MTTPSGPADAPTHVEVEDDTGVRTITIDRPEVQNALTMAMRRRLCALLAAADRDAAVRVVVLTGVDPAFCAGVDFTDLDPAFDPDEARQSNPFLARKRALFALFLAKNAEKPKMSQVVSMMRRCAFLRLSCAEPRHTTASCRSPILTVPG